MTGRLGHRLRAAEFADVVDGTATDDVRSRHAELLATVDRLVHVPQPRLDAEFSSRLRERLMAEADDALGTPAAERRLRLPERTPRARHRLASAAAAVVVVGSTAGVAAAAQEAVPGDALYGVKVGLEHIQTDLTPGDVRRGQAYVDHARDRLTELRQLVGDRPDARAQALIGQTLDSFDDNAQHGAALIIRGYQRDHDVNAVSSLRTFAAQAMADLASTGAAAPASTFSSFTDAAGVIAAIDQEAAAQCQQCGGAPVALPSSLLSPAPDESLNQLAADPSVAPKLAAASTAHEATLSDEAKQADTVVHHQTHAPGSAPAKPTTSIPEPSAPSAPKAPAPTPPEATKPVTTLVHSVSSDAEQTTKAVTDTVQNTVKSTTDTVTSVTKSTTTTVSNTVNSTLGSLRTVKR